VRESYATVWEAIADAIPNTDALVQADRRVTWSAFDDRSARLAGGFAGMGIGRGSHVALFLQNCPEYVEALTACLKLRAVATGLNFRAAPRELAALVTNARAEVLVFHRVLGDVVAAALPELSGVRALVEVDDGRGAARVADAIAFEDLVAAHDPALRVGRAGTDRLLWYTGGTTGIPKGVVWEQQTLLGSGYEYGAALLGRNAPQTVPDAARTAVDLAATDRRIVTLVTTPLAHATAANQLHVALSLGGALVLLPPGRVEGDEICRTIQRERVRVLSVVGDVVLRRIVDALERAEARGKPYDMSSLWRVHSSGAMASPAAKDALHRRAPASSFYDSLGATEGVGFGVALTTGAGDASLARFRLGPHARVLDADDRDVVPGSGDAGILAVTGPTGLAYHDDPARTAATFRVIGDRRYAVLGDWAVPHPDGTITFLGRGSGCINTGGEKVWPEEVEEVLKAHPTVVDALVVGIPDDEWGAAVAAVVAIDTRGDGAGAPTAGELASWVSAHLARYKRPRRIELVDEVRRNAVGKPDYEWARSRFTGPPVTS
jgi:fatty-acyl-CoA synthase